jgi:hypothetical protein
VVHIARYKSCFYSLIHMYHRCFCSNTINNFTFLWPLTIHRIHFMSYVYTHDELQNVTWSLLLNAVQCWLCLNLWHLITYITIWLWAVRGVVGIMTRLQTGWQNHGSIHERSMKIFFLVFKAFRLRITGEIHHSTVCFHAMNRDFISVFPSWQDECEVFDLPRGHVVSVACYWQPGTASWSNNVGNKLQNDIAQHPRRPKTSPRLLKALNLVQGEHAYFSTFFCHIFKSQEVKLR